MRKIINSRKGQGLVEAFSVLAIISITGLFFILFNLPSCAGPPSRQLSSDALNDLKMGYEINSYLRTPVEYQGMEFSVGDLIVLAAENNIERPRLINEEPFSTEVFDTSDGALYLSELEQYLERDRDKVLTAATINFMKAYADFIPASVSEGYYCSVSLVAEHYNDNDVKQETISLFDMSYFGFAGRASCPVDFVISETRIPAYNGYIKVQIRSKFNVARLSGQIAGTLGAFGTFGALPASLVAYYIWS